MRKQPVKTGERRWSLCKKLYRLSVLLSWLTLAWGLLGNMMFIRYSVIANYDGTSSDIILDANYTTRPTISIADQLYHLESSAIPSRNGFLAAANNTIYILSAIGRNSSEDSFYDTIVLNAWELETKWTPVNYSCCLIYDENNLEFLKTKPATKQDWIYRRSAKLEVKQFMCPNVFHGEKRVPVGITIAGEKGCPRNTTAYVKVDLPKREIEDKLAVCAKLAFGKISASSIVEWMEYQKIMNVSKVLLFASNLNSAGTKVLQYYSDAGFLTFFQFTLPMKDYARRGLGWKTFQSWNDEQITVFDCIGRLAGYKYLGLYDLDEYIFPKTTPDLLEMLKKLRRSFENAAGFTFLTEVYTTSWEQANETSTNDMIIRRYQLRTKELKDRVKSIIITDRVWPGRLSTHGYWARPNYEKQLVSSSLATTKHYRSCRRQWQGETCNKLMKQIPDHSMFPVADILAPRVQKVKRTLGLI